ncbi:SSD domain-containing protein [Trichostrongylus colubriformis]|uniref:SSD domain-containing protein n=1 Tax=Trichostrongylus colubriformis TaxID=6319 RepID=A0AAN8GD18_TRICO
MFTAFCSVGFVRFHQINNARITYTDSESPSHVEARVLQTFLQQNGTLNMVEIMIESKDNGSLLRDNYRQQIWDLIHEINTELTVKNSSGHGLTYHDMCEPYCQKNDAFFALLKLYDQNFSRIDVTYPTMDILGKQIFIASNIYGVSLVNDTNNIESFTTVILRYYMVYPETKPLLEWESKLVSLLYDSGKFDLLQCSAGSDNLVAKEEMGTKTAPLLSIALGVLMIFLMLCSFRFQTLLTKLHCFIHCLCSNLQTFAIYSVAASVICYFYQLILFPAILTLTAHKEYKTIDDGSK